MTEFERMRREADALAKISDGFAIDFMKLLGHEAAFKIMEMMVEAYDKVYEHGKQDTETSIDVEFPNKILET